MKKLMEFMADQRALFSIWDEGSTNKTAEKRMEKINRKTEQLLKNCDRIALCGLTPFCKKAISILNRYGKDIFIIDIVPVDVTDYDGIKIYSFEEAPFGEQTLYILCSRTMIAEYLYRLNSNNHIIGWHCLLLLDLSFNLDQYDFTQEKIKRQLADVCLNQDKYKQLLNRLEDDLSRYLLQRILLFRLTLDVRYNMNVGSKYIHYFDEDIISLSEHESFVDAGGFNGDTLIQFLKLTNNKFDNYYLFEPENELIIEAKKNINRSEN